MPKLEWLDESKYEVVGPSEPTVSLTYEDVLTTFAGAVILNKQADRDSKKELAKALKSLQQIEQRHIEEVIDSGDIKMNDLGADAYEAQQRIMSEQYSFAKRLRYGSQVDKP